MTGLAGWPEVHARRDLGIERSTRRCEPDWTREAAGYLRWYAQEVARGQPFLLEDAREVCGAHGVRTPPNERAWGAAVRYAVHQRWLTKAGYAPARSSNGSPKCLWRSTP